MKINLNKIPLDDKKVFDLINSGKTAGMFQISALPTTELCKEMKINNFEDISAAIALVRPGPFKSGMAKEYIERKHGKKWEPMHPIYEEVTKHTYGILVYQEQVIQVISRVAGLPESTADRIRKVIGKKRTAKEFKPYWEQFRNGCKKMKTLSLKEAKEFWNGLLEWASYGFNRSHSIAYSLIGYQTAWLKANFPIEFICSCLSFADYDDNKTEDARQKKELLEEIMEHNITIMPPKIGLSDPIKWLVKDNKLYVPFIEIIGFGEQQANKSAKSKARSKPKLIGFFGKEYETSSKAKTKNEVILDELKAHDLNKMPDDKILLKYLPFSIGKSDMVYNSLKRVLSFDFSKHIISRLKILDLHEEEVPKGLIQRIRFSNTELLGCNKCGLRDECDSPVMPSLGIYNAMILGEGPGPQEDKHKRGFYEEAPAGELLWRELDKYGLNRRMFHISNVVKCFLSPDVEIITSKGVRVISKIKIDDFVLTHKGEFKKVKWVSKNNFLPRRSKVIAMRYSFKKDTKERNQKRSIKITHEHPFLVRPKQSRFSKWEKAENIKVGDKIKVLAKKCLYCNGLMPLYSTRTYCSQKCATIYCNKTREWTNEDRKKRSDGMKRLYKSGIINKNIITSNANKANKQKVENGTHHLLKKNRKVINPWKGETIYINEKLRKLLAKVKITNIKSGHLKRFSELGTKALNNYYKTNERTFNSKNKLTKIEAIMAWALRKRNITNFVQNKYLKGYYPDILFIENYLIIECDGSHWHENEMAKKRDAKRDLKLEKAGYTILRFTDKEIEKDVFGCIDKIERILKNHNNEYEFTEVEVIGIREVTIDKKYQLYNFGVSEDNSYIANGLVSHNCYPSETRTPKANHIEACSYWLSEEFNKLQTRLVLAFGNTSVKALTGQDGGITNLSGTTEWLPAFGFWVCWALHPAAVKRRGSNKEYFEKGIRNFVRKFELLRRQ